MIASFPGSHLDFMQNEEESGKKDRISWLHSCNFWGGILNSLFMISSMNFSSGSSYQQKQIVVMEMRSYQRDQNLLNRGTATGTQHIYKFPVLS